MADDPKKIAAEKQKLAAQKAKIKAEKLHQKRMENDAKYRHDYEIESKKQWRETRRENSAKEQEILDQKAINERNWTDMREKDLHEATKKRIEAEDAYRAELNESKAERSKAGELAEKFQKEKEQASQGADQVALEKQLDKLGGVLGSNSTEQSNALIAEFKSIKVQLDNPDLNPLEREVLMAELDQISKGADAEEERREKQKEVEDSQSVLLRMANGIDKTASGFDSLRDGLLKGGGIIAALGAIALIFFDPETLMKGVTIALEKINEIVGAIGKIIDGDWQGGFNDLLGFAGDNKLIIAGVAALFGGSILRGLGSMFTTAKSLSAFIGKVGKVIKTVSLALRAAALASATAMGSMLSGMVAFLAPFAIPIAIAAAIALVVAGIGFALVKLRDALGFSSVFDLILVAVAGMKDAFAHLNNLLAKVVNFIGGIVEKFGRFFGADDFDMPEMEFMDTDNMKKKVIEMRAKAEKEENDKKIKKRQIEEAGMPEQKKTGPNSVQYMKDIDGNLIPVPGSVEPTNFDVNVEEESTFMKTIGLDSGKNEESFKALNRLQAAENRKELNAEKLFQAEAELSTAKEKAAAQAAQNVINTNLSNQNTDNSSTTNVINNYTNPGKTVGWKKRGFAPLGQN